MFKTILYSILGIIVFFAILFGIHIGLIQWQRVTKPMIANVERETFVETLSFNQGKIQQLSKYKLEYDQAESVEDKEIIANTIRHTFADYNTENLPDGLKYFLVNIRGY